MRRLGKRIILVAALALTPATAASPAAPPSGTEADHIALRQLKSDAIDAINRQDFARARQLTHDPFLATVVTQDSFNDFGKLVAFYKSLYADSGPDRPRMKAVTISANADELSQIYTGTFAVTRGSTLENYTLADGRSFDLKGRWTGVSIKEGDGWKMLAVHTGTNFLDNPVLEQYERAAIWGSAGGLLAGLIAGFFLGRFIRRRPRQQSPAE
jgi:ketosteroid isomerase-like protein